MKCLVSHVSCDQVPFQSPTLIFICTSSLFIISRRVQIESMTKQHTDVTTRIATLTSASASSKSGGASAEDLARVAALTSELPSLEAAAKSALSASAKAEAEVSSLQRTILEAGGERVRRAKARLDRAAEAASEVEKLLTKAQAQIKASEKSE